MKKLAFKNLTRMKAMKNIESLIKTSEMYLLYKKIYKSTSKITKKNLKLRFLYKKEHNVFSLSLLFFEKRINCLKTFENMEDGVNFLLKNSFSILLQHILSSYPDKTLAKKYINLVKDERRFDHLKLESALKAIETEILMKQLNSELNNKYQHSVEDIHENSKNDDIENFNSNISLFLESMEVDSINISENDKSLKKADENNNFDSRISIMSKIDVEKIGEASEIRENNLMKNKIDIFHLKEENIENNFFEIQEEDEIENILARSKAIDTKNIKEEIETKNIKEGIETKNKFQKKAKNAKSTKPAKKYIKDIEAQELKNSLEVQKNPKKEIQKVQNQENFDRNIINNEIDEYDRERNIILEFCACKSLPMPEYSFSLSFGLVTCEMLFAGKYFSSKPCFSEDDALQNVCLLVCQEYNYFKNIEVNSENINGNEEKTDNNNNVMERIVGNKKVRYVGFYELFNSESF